jgi:uncharacterized protein YfdQ (DUF2303 family)
MADKSDASEIMASISAPKVNTANNLKGAFATVPDGYRLESLEDFQAQPNTICTDHKFRDTKSLAAYLDKFKTDASIAFSRPSQRKINCVLDHHSPDAPSHGRHRASFCAKFTAQFEAWRSKHGKGMSQIAAGLFLEERAVDVVSPSAADIMDMVMTFDALKKVTFRQSTRLHDGQRQFTYNEENEVRGNVTLPERITILVPVFEGQEPERIEVRVRYRIEDGSLKFQFEIHDIEHVQDQAFERCEDSLSAELSDPIMTLRVV